MEKPTGFVCPIGNCMVTGPTHGPYGYCNLQASARANTVNLIPIIVLFPVYIQHVYCVLFSFVVNNAKFQYIEIVMLASLKNKLAQYFPRQVWLHSVAPLFCYSFALSLLPA